MLCGIDHVWSSKECMCCACDPSMHIDVPSISYVCYCVFRKLSPHLRVAELDHKGLLSSYCFFV